MALLPMLSTLTTLWEDVRIMRYKVTFLSLVGSMYFLSAVAIKMPIQFAALSPRGLRIKLKDNGFSSFHFAGILTTDTGTRELFADVLEVEQGYWTYIYNDINLSIGDTIKYTATVLKNRKHHEIIGTWTISEFVSKDSNCEISATTTPCSSRTCKNTLIFSEEFNDDNFRWHKENMFPQEPDYPFNIYSKDGIRRIDNGTLIIRPMLTSEEDIENWDFSFACTGETGTRECSHTQSDVQILPPVLSGKISTRKIFSFKYGRIEVRAKLPVGDWLIPEINLEPLHNEYGRNHYGSGLMRIAYIKGNREYSEELYGGPVLFHTEPYRSLFLKKIKKSSGHWNDNFHVYTLIWQPDGIQLKVDGTVYGDIKPINSSDVKYTVHDIPHAKVWTQGTSMAPLDQMFYISLGVRVGGINDFPDSPSKPWKNSNCKAMYKFWQDKPLWHQTWTSPQMEVDYVRVYAL